MTALAAAIALSSPALAQSLDEPVVTTTPAVEVTPEPVAADPVVPIADTSADPLAAEAAPATTVRKAAPARASAARSRPAAARASSPAISAAPAAAIAAPVAEPPVAQPLPPPTEIAAGPIDEPTNSTINDMLPAVAIGGVALLLLIGAVLAVRRRRRRAEEAENADGQYVETDAEAAAEPAMTVEPEPAYVEPEPAKPAFVAAAPVAAAVAMPALGSDEVEGPVTELPEDFDLSRFGHNVQQAYKGPTEDNPSLSLKHRLRRGSGMDAQERVLDAEVEAVTGEPVLDESVLDKSDPAPLAEAPAANPAIGHQVDGDRPLDRAAKPGVSPAESK